MRFWTVGHLHDEVMRVATLTKSGAEVLSLYQMSQTRATHFRITTRGPAIKEVDVLSSVNLLHSRITLAGEPQGDCSRVGVGWQPTLDYPRLVARQYVNWRA